jgi:hypothetical protein
MLDTIDNHAKQVSIRDDAEDVIKTKLGVVAAADTFSDSATLAAEYLDESVISISEMLPKSIGTSTDALAAIRVLPQHFQAGWNGDTGDHHPFQ